MAKLFTEKLANIEKELDELRNQPLTINNELIAPINQRLTDCETKINELIEQITPILLSHANALKEILATLKK